ncbi:MAG: hypothetical protein ACI84E_001883 [Planctomycetota bacterium]|jgi:hypothetical protein
MDTQAPNELEPDQAAPPRSAAWRPWALGLVALAMGAIVGMAILSSEFGGARFPAKLLLLVPLIAAAILLGKQAKGALPILVFGFLLGAAPLPILYCLGHVLYDDYPALQ